MTMDLNSAKRMIKHCRGDGRQLEYFDPSALLFTLKQLTEEVERMWNLHPDDAPRRWVLKQEVGL